MSGQSSSDDIFIFIMRHGEAESLLANELSRDIRRELTKAGRAEVNRSSVWLAEHYCQGNPVSLALVSPYVRARQTYEEVTNNLAFTGVEVCDDITPEGNVKLSHDYLDTLISSLHPTSTPTSILLVSHMPFVSYFLDELCGAGHMSLFATGSVAVVRYSPSTSQGQLLQHYQGFPS